MALWQAVNNPRRTLCDDRCLLDTKTEGCLRQILGIKGEELDGQWLADFAEAAGLAIDRAFQPRRHHLGPLEPSRNRTRFPSRGSTSGTL